VEGLILNTKISSTTVQSNKNGDIKMECLERLVAESIVKTIIIPFRCIPKVGTPASINRFGLSEREANFHPSCYNLNTFAPLAQSVVPRSTNTFENPLAPKPRSSTAP